MSQLTIRRKVHSGQGDRTRKELRRGEKKDVEVKGGVPHVSRLMALAIKFEQLIRDGDVANLADLARLGHVSRSRALQIMNLLNLAPEIQEKLLFLEPGNSVSERRLREVTGEDWALQRKMLRQSEQCRCAGASTAV